MYLIDSDVFIQAKNLYYPFEVVPDFWKWIVRMHDAGKAFSVSAVFDELISGNDELSDWAKGLPSSFFLEPDGETAYCMHQLTNWANTHPNYTSIAAQTFFSSADLVLVAHADAHGHTIVTQETSAPESKSRIKLPDACDYMGVKHCNTFEWIRLESTTFGFTSGP